MEPEVLKFKLISGFWPTRIHHPCSTLLNSIFYIKWQDFFSFSFDSSEWLSLHVKISFWSACCAHVFSRSFSTSPASRKYAKIRYHFVARNVNELSVLQDEILEVWRLKNHVYHLKCFSKTAMRFSWALMEFSLKFPLKLCQQTKVSKVRDLIMNSSNSQKMIWS